ncbi:glucose PTS transporter subunit IIA [Agrilactobacillus fermenti]|uniref:glucose PTS transporter subunit IIA n=1 Tax=Agrilactobacillus fermenti TaxID=2586909 RepID=UPI001E2F81B3|nr:glucose PTS transporter subunit IIA [Agrilactobacillus fermenti]MCD2257314.1 PTS glucose transporter subunit IIA [Agrilactobacillus fermenti]
MSTDKVQRIANEIYQNVGGPDNVDKLIHCMTRVRMTIKDPSKVDLTGLKAIDGVMGVVEDDTLQVVVGPGTVNKVAQAMVDQVGVELGEPFPASASATSTATDQDLVNQKAAEVKAAQKAKQKQTPIKRALKSISNIFIPLIPVFVGAGLIGGIAAVLSNMMVAGQIGNNWSELIMVLNVIKNGVFAYLVIYVGINSAQEFGATPGLGGVIGAVTLLNGVTPKTPLHNIFTGQDLVAGQGGILGVIFAVWVLALVEKRLHKWIPDSIDIIITPTLTLLSIGLFTIFIVMPIAGVISDGLVGAISWILNVGGAFSGFALGALFLPMVMFGLHQILTPIHIEMINKTGMTPLLPILAMAGAGQVGAALALWIRCRRNKQLTNLIKGALPVGFLGIGEPLIYGVTLPLGKPFITACIGGGIGGAIIGGLGNIGSIAIGPSGLALVPLINNGQWLGYVFGLLGGYAGGFVATYFFGIPKDAISDEEPKAAPVATDNAVDFNAAPADNVALSENTIYAPVKGQVVPIKSVSDEMMATEVMGKSMAIVPDKTSAIYAPISGKITFIADTGHAIGFTSDQGEEVMIHIGIDTVNLAGKPFQINVAVDDHVTHGQTIGQVDWQRIIAAGLDPVTITIVTNSPQFAIEKQTLNQATTFNTALMTLKPNLA